jgi:hypothetical protein
MSHTLISFSPHYQAFNDYRHNVKNDFPSTDVPGLTRILRMIKHYHDGVYNTDLFHIRVSRDSYRYEFSAWHETEYQYNDDKDAKKFVLDMGTLYIYPNMRRGYVEMFNDKYTRILVLYFRNLAYSIITKKFIPVLFERYKRTYWKPRYDEVMDELKTIHRFPVKRKRDSEKIGVPIKRICLSKSINKE